MIEIYPPYDDFAVRVELWGRQIETIRKFDPLTGQIRVTAKAKSRAIQFTRKRTTFCPLSKENAPFKASTKSSNGGKANSSGREKSSNRSASCNALTSTSK